MRAQMRQETQRKLEREFWRRRLIWGIYGVAGAALLAVGLYLTNLDAEVDDTQIAGTVEEVERFVSQRGGQEGWRIGVKLSDGRRIFVLAGKDNKKNTGDSIKVTAHHHHTGRTTFTLK